MYYWKYTVLAIVYLSLPDLAGTFLVPGSVVPEDTAWAVPGYSTKLNCDIKGGNVSTVLWYRGEHPEPIYTYDARSNNGRSAFHWSEKEPIGLGQRVSFMTGLSDDSYLEVKDVRPGDEGIYRCRVDFKRAQTRNKLISLSFVDEPRDLTVFHINQAVKNSLVGPVNAGTAVNLNCVVVGGQPPPAVLWYRNNQLIDSTYIASRENGGRVVNEIILHRVGEKDVLDTFTCRAINNNITKPLEVAFKIGINFPPKDVEIQELPQKVYAGRTQSIRCIVKGSSPSAVITWWKDGQYLDRPMEFVEENRTVSSVIQVMLTREDNGKDLACRAQNPVIQGSKLESKLVLDVLYSPRADLKFGASINPANIIEGQDVYMECIVDANPKLNKILWKVDGMIVVPQRNLLMSGMNLVLQGVHRNQTGNYTCTVSNNIGDSESSPVELKVLHRPACSSGSAQDLYIRLNEDVTIECGVDSYPAPTNFWWSFNNSFQLTKLPQDQFSWSKDRSYLNYRPKSQLDFGVISCWASNPIGTMDGPCMYNLHEADTSTTKLECSVQNQTLTTLLVSCAASKPHNPDQFLYHLEIRERDGGELVQNLTSTSPWFFIQDLPPDLSGSGLNLTIYTSEPSGSGGARQTLAVFSSKVAELQAESDMASSLPQIYLLGAGVGAVICLFLLMFGMLIFIRINKLRRIRNGQSSGSLEHSVFHCSSSHLRDDSTNRRPSSDSTQPVEYTGGLDLGGESTEYQGIDLLSPLNNTSSQNQRHVQLREEIFMLKNNDPANQISQMPPGGPGPGELASISRSSSYTNNHRSSGSIGEGVRIPGLAGSIEGVRLTTAVNNAATGSIEGGRHATSGSHTMQRNRKSTNSQHSLLTLPRSHSSYRQQFSSATAIAPPSRVTPSGVLGEHAGTVPHTAQPPPSSALSSTQHSPLEDSGLPRRKQFQDVDYAKSDPRYLRSMDRQQLISGNSSDPLLAEDSIRNILGNVRQESIL